jgi:uncharacterized protein YutE (UPF0331/DUF86 family)
MYFIDREAIEDKLRYLETQTNLLRNQGEWTGSVIEKLALERIFQTIVDAILDVGNAMIDGFIMRDPGSYEDIIDILLDEKVISTEMEPELKALLPYRKELVQTYTTIHHEKLQKTIYENLNTIQQFPACIRSYIETELGVVTAFKPYNK